MKLRDLIATASGNLWRSKLRTLLTIIAIFIGAMTLTLTNGIGSGIQTYIDEQLGNIGAEDMLIIQRQADNNPFEDEPQKYEESTNIAATGVGFALPVLTESDLEKIKSQPGIKSAELRVAVSPAYIKGPSGERFKAPFVDYYYEGMNLTMEAGTVPNNQTAKPQVVLVPGDQKYLGFESADSAVGTIIIIGTKTPAGEVREIEATVVGVPASTLVATGTMLSNNALIEALYEAQTEGLPAAAQEQYFVATARFDTSMSDEEVTILKKNLADQGFSATTIQDQIGIFKQVIDAIIMVLNFFAGIALLAASFGIVNTLLMAVQERTKEIGLMKAMGMGRRKVFLLFSIEAILLGFWGSLLGSLAGLGLGAVVNNVASKTFLKELTGFELTSFPITSVLSIMGLIMLIAFLAGTLPARRASKKDPIEALRTE